MMKKVLITYPIPKEGLWELFENYDVSYPDQAGMDHAEILDVIADYDALIPPGAKIDRVILEAATKLQVISNYGVGYDNIDVAYCTAKGILVTNIPEAVTESAAELAFGLMIAVMRRIVECDHHLRSEADFDWGIMQNLGHNLFGKTLGIIGMGRIGRALARRARAFGMKLIYTDQQQLPAAQEVELGAVYRDFATLLKNADVLSVHVPYSVRTHHLIGEKELAALQPTAVIVNTSRGPVIDEAALVKHLKTGRIAGAGLDVFEQEPLITPELKSLDQVVLTPHIGTATVENRVLMARAVAKNIIDFFSSGTAPFMVNPEVISKK